MAMVQYDTIKEMVWEALDSYKAPMSVAKEYCEGSKLRWSQVEERMVLDAIHEYNKTNG